ncbi:PH domain-containing protein [Yinghuangia sp. ASG 101]|uniref:PH domain-containing protein n=1 Tax=Yinghuangia sp. ASG 101 TaxID=2896848 RepID=UPI001E411F9C|nr:PH domain-containing protein [Yinghuangia sp. ASG 101]UGQ14452.1 PH domain-containing protein [Yinghuangia sp. ASG 101]
MDSDEGVTTYRSRPAVFTGVVLLAVGLWLVVDSVVRDGGATALLVVGVVLAVGAVVVALTLRAAVFAGPDRLRIRNPFRTIDIPWSEVREVRAEYSLEVRTSGDRGFHVWAIPVSLRERKRAMRVNARSQAEDPYGGGHPTVPQAAWADHAVADFRGMAERFATTSTGEVTVAWYWPVPAAVAVGVAFVIVGSVL